MVQIDKTDKLYKYLLGLGEENIDKVYLELAENGIFEHKDIVAYFNSTFETIEIDENIELNYILDYFKDVKKLKKLPKNKIRESLVNYYETKDEKIKKDIINSYLEEVLTMAIFYYNKAKKNYVRKSTADDELTIEDCVSDANIGLIKAIEKYNPKARISFDDYLIYYVRKMLKKEKEND